MSRNDQYLNGQFSFGANSTPVTEDEEPFFVEIEDASPSSPPPAPTGDNAPPQWFNGAAKQKAPSPPPAPPQRKRKPASPQQRKKPLKRAPIVAADDEEENLTWQEQLNRWVQEGGGAGFGVSVLVHAVLLLLMSLWILHLPQDEELITTVEQTDMADVASIKDVDLDVDLKPVIEEQINKPDFEPAPLSMPDLGIGSLASSLDSKAAGGLALKIPSQAVTKGSFTVWTVPEDPKPGERYMIMIQLKLKNNIKRYPRRDLSGNVVGTDGYKDYFGGPTESGYVTVNGDTVTIEACPVPGAAQLVKDVIKVESKILKEKQTIELVF